MNASDIPDDIAAAVLKMGPVEWGAVPAQSDEAHLEGFRETLRITRETFGLEGDRDLSGLYLAGTDTVLCHTGTSPNSANNARALAGAWNHLLELLRAASDEAKAARPSCALDKACGEVRVMCATKSTEPCIAPSIISNDELRAAETLLDKIAANTDAAYASMTSYTLPDRIFYSVELHKDRVVRSGRGDTLADALAAAEASVPFDTRGREVA